MKNCKEDKPHNEMMRPNREFVWMGSSGIQLVDCAFKNKDFGLFENEKGRVPELCDSGIKET